jgi:hypothetical protein
MRMIEIPSIIPLSLCFYAVGVTIILYLAWVELKELLERSRRIINAKDNEIYNLKRVVNENETER